jgi:hypothetical protein
MIITVGATQTGAAAALEHLRVCVGDVERSKRRAVCLCQLSWLNLFDVLIVRADPQEPLVVARMLPEAETAKGPAA